MHSVGTARKSAVLGLVLAALLVTAPASLAAVDPERLNRGLPDKPTADAGASQPSGAERSSGERSSGARGAFGDVTALGDPFDASRGIAADAISAAQGLAAGDQLPRDKRGFYARGLISQMTYETGEPLSVDDTQGCIDGADGNPYQTGRSAWFKFTGTGGDIVITDFGGHASGVSTEHDTLLAIYPASPRPTSATLLSCDVGRAGTSSGFSFVGVANSVPGREYLLQVGNVVGGPAPADAADLLALTFNTADLSAFPHALDLNSSGSFANVATSTEAAEPLTCGATSYGATQWFAFTVPAQGQVTFNVSSNEIPPTINIFPAGSLSSLACGAGSPQAPNASASVQLPAGQYRAHVGSVGNTWGGFNYTLQFAENFDVDGDGIFRRPQGGDCDDTNAAIRPGVTEPGGSNGIDENCNDVVDEDADNDGVPRAPIGNDCDDSNAAVTPGKRDIRGNRLNEDCSADGPAGYAVLGTTLSFTPVTGPTTTRLSARLRSIPRGARLRGTCRGRGCFRSFTRRFSRRTSRFSLNRYVRRRAWAPGTRIEFRLSAPEHFTAVWQFRMLRGASPEFSGKRCLRPGSRRVGRCP